MKRLHLIWPILFLWMMAGVVFAQVVTEPSFERVQQIGRSRPQGIRYEPNFDQYVLVDDQAQLLLTNALFEPTHTLYESGAYNAYIFSHDGRWLALAIDRRLELWDTQSGELLATFEPTGANLATGPLFFSEDDSFLVVNSVVPAPQALRRSENDTRNLPWLWDVWNALNIERPRLPGQLDAVTFFDYINAPVFVLGPGYKMLAPLQNRFFILDALSQEVAADVATDRFEPDPFDVWFSAREQYMYVRPVNGSGLFQIDSEGRSVHVFEVPVGYELNAEAIRRQQDLALSGQARIIGKSNTLETNSLLRLLLGENYPYSYGAHPLTVTLIDILQPVTVTRDQFAVLLYIHDEQAGRGYIEFVRPNDTVQMVLHPNGDHLALRRASGQQPIEVYSLDSGALIRNYYPALPDPTGEHILAYNASGDVLISDFQRFDSSSGDVLWEDLRYTNPFEQFYFTQNSDQIVTLSNFGTEWWLWDITTGQPIRREQVNLLGGILEVSPDAHRFLTQLDSNLLEIVDVGTEERRLVSFENVPGRTITSITPNDDWTNFIVIYTGGEISDDVALYNIDEGKRWYISGADLPYLDNRSYSWLDHDTALVSSQDLGSGSPQPRFYGLDFHPSGLPNCLVRAFPGEWTHWLNIWERVNAQLQPARFAQLTQQICGALPANIEVIEALFTPTPQPTREPIVPTQSAVAGVPACLTSRFPQEALAYASDWREITDGLSQEEVEQLEALLCEGLTGNPSTFVSRGDSGANTQVMTIDINTGVRTVSAYVPPVNRETPRSLELVINEFDRQYRRYPENARLSPNGQLLATFGLTYNVNIYRLLKPYETVVAEATATSLAVVANQTSGPNIISVRPTSTQPAEWLGQPRPTLTPTVTPTSPPPAEATEALVLRDEVEDSCPAQTLYTLENPPPDYNPTGRFLTTYPGSFDIWVFNLLTGEWKPDESIPNCAFELPCEYSPDRRWILIRADDLYVMRADGSDVQVLFEARERSAWPGNIFWLDNDTLQYSYQDYIPELSVNPFTFYRRYDVETREYSDPFFLQTTININGLPTSILAEQPVEGRFAAVHTDFNAGERQSGSKYYIYDRQTNTYDYFARLVGAEMIFEWDPLGRALYYRYPDQSDWFVFDPQTGEHRVYGWRPDGDWSPDYRFRARWLSITEQQVRVIEETIEEVSEQATDMPDTPIDIPTREELGAALPKIAIWDRETGLTRTFCFPRSALETFNTTLYWSPDNRYLIFNTYLPEYYIAEVQRPFTLLLDTETGYLTALSFEITDIIGWIE